MYQPSQLQARVQHHTWRTVRPATALEAADLATEKAIFEIV